MYAICLGMPGSGPEHVWTYVAMIGKCLKLSGNVWTYVDMSGRSFDMSGAYVIPVLNMSGTGVDM